MSKNKTQTHTDVVYFTVWAFSLSESKMSKLFFAWFCSVSTSPDEDCLTNKPLATSHQSPHT